MELISGGPHSSLERERKIFLCLLPTSPIKREIRYFHVVVVQCQERKCTKKCDAREELLFCLINLLFSFLPFSPPSPLPSPLLKLPYEMPWKK